MGRSGARSRRITGTCHRSLFSGARNTVSDCFRGSLKLKEISYIHAEGYAAGELKHGPIALIVDGVPVIVLSSNDELNEKTQSNSAEVAARGSRLAVRLLQIN